MPGWETGVWLGFSAYAEMEHVAQIGFDDYKEGPGPVDPSNAGRFPVVADPPGTELNQAYVKYTGIEDMTITVGRQIINYRKAPFHRFVGTVLWRQNWQTHDGVTLNYALTENLDINYGYSSEVNRIFCDDAPSPFDTFDCDCHFINGQYRAFPHLNLEAYGYLVDIDNAVLNSTNTGGIRASGRYPISETMNVLYAGEFATQSDAAGNPRSINADYYLGEVGLGFTFKNKIATNLTVKFDYEMLEGNGIGSFITPLATGHAFQGWADRFLTTLLDGIEDMYVTAVAKVMRGKFIFSYRMLESDNMNYDYGNELDILYAYKFKKYWTVGAKAAIYDADRNVTSLARAGGTQNDDVTKLWVWMQFDY